MKFPVYRPHAKPAGAQDHGPFKDSSQFPDVPEPRVILQGLHRLLLNRNDLFPQIPGISLCDGLEQQRDVFFPVPESRGSDGEDMEPILKVLPESTLEDLFLFQNLPQDAGM
jgi:hypothetical protein